MTIETIPFDAADYLDTPEAVAAFLDEAFNEGDLAAVAHALDVVARAKGVTIPARVAGQSHQAIGKSLVGDRDPRLSTLLDLASALGVKLHVSPA